jgi:hypothetical protein
MEKIHFDFDVSGEFLDITFVGYFADPIDDFVEAHDMLSDVKDNMISALREIGVLDHNFHKDMETPTDMRFILSFDTQEIQDRFSGYDEIMDFLSEYLWSRIPRMARRYIVN